MKILLILICSIIAFFIIKEKGSKRIQWLIIGLLFTLLDIEIVSSPPITSHKLYLIAYYISLYTHNEFIKEFRNYPFKIITLLLGIFSFCVGFADERLTFLSQIQRGFSNILELSSLFIGYSCINTVRDYVNIQKKSCKFLIIICIYGICTWILKGNPYYDFVTTLFNDNGVGIWSEIQERGYRVCSTFSNPIVYGFVLNTFLLLLWESKERKYLKISNFLIILICINILLANSRTNLVTTTISVSLYFLLKYGLSKKLFFYTSFISFSLVVCYFYITPVQNILDSVFDIFLTGGANTKGTTLDLKEQQQAMSYLFFLQAPYFGNGYDYFAENILSGKVLFYNGELAGLEGYGYKLLVEQGIFMIIANIIYMLCIIYFLIKHFHNSISKLSLALFVAFIIFILTTGTYGGVIYYTFILLGMNIKIIQQNKLVSNK